MIRDRLPSIDREQAVAAALVAMLVLGAPAGYAIAQTLSHQSTAGVHYETNDGLTVELTDDREVEASPFDGDGTFADGNLSLASPGSGSIAIGDDAYSGSEIVVTDVEATNPITVTRSDLDREFTVESGDAATLQVRDYEVDNDSTDLAYSSQNGLSITLTDLPSEGIAAVDPSTGDVLDSAVVGTTEDTATFDLPSGTRSVELQSVPSELQVRNEANPDELIDDNVTLRVRFFADEDTVIEREVSDGTVSLDGLPADEEIVVTVKESNANYTYRRILLDSIVETSEIYLLPTTEPSAEVRFELRDETGRFVSGETKLFVEKPITRDNNTEYRARRRGPRPRGAHRLRRRGRPNRRDRGLDDRLERHGTPADDDRATRRADERLRRNLSARYVVRSRAGLGDGADRRPAGLRDAELRARDRRRAGRL